VTAVSAGEGLIDGVSADSSWTWVDKSDPKVYYPWLYRMWLSQAILTLAYFVIIIVFVKLKDVH